MEREGFSKLEESRVKNQENREEKKETAQLIPADNNQINSKDPL